MRLRFFVREGVKGRKGDNRKGARRGRGTVFRKRDGPRRVGVILGQAYLST